MHDVFISCCPGNLQLAARLLHQLERNGLSCRMSEDWGVSDVNYTEEMQNVIGSCRAVIAVITGSALDSAPFLEELEFAVRSGKQIIPVLLENCRLTTEIRFLIGGEQHLFAFQMDERSLEQQLLFKIRGNGSWPQLPANTEPAPPAQKVNLKLIREKQFQAMACTIKVMTEDGKVYPLTNGSDVTAPVSVGKQVIHFTGSFRRTKIELEITRDTTLLVKWNRWSGHIEVESLSGINLKILQKK